MVPLQIPYWSLLLLICWRSELLPAIVSAYSQPTSRGWWILNLIVGLIPLPILLRNTPLLRTSSLVVAWLAIALLIPLIEESYWRGVLENLTRGWPTSFALAYTSLLFALAHPLLWGVFSVGNRSWQTFIALLVMGAVWVLPHAGREAYKRSCCRIALWTIGNMSVWVFMNLYVPPR